jgi:hypothetical protein
MTYRVISETHGLVWAGDDAGEADDIALMVAVNGPHALPSGRNIELMIRRKRRLRAPPYPEEI